MNPFILNLIIIMTFLASIFTACINTICFVLNLKVNYDKSVLHDAIKNNDIMLVTELLESENYVSEYRDALRKLHKIIK